MPSESRPNPEAASGRRVLPIVLVILATVIGFASVMAVWVKRQALETETWTETSSELLEDEDIRTAVTDFIVTALFDNVDVQAELEKRLPDDLDAFSGPAASGVRELATRATNEALSRPKVQALWEDANRFAHERLLLLLDDEAEFVATTDGVVTLDLSGILAEVAETVGIGVDIESKLPEEAGQLEIMRSDELAAAQDGVQALRTAGYILSALTFVLYGIAIFLAGPRRREILRAVGFSFVAIGVLTLFARNAGGDAVTTSLTTTAAAEPAVTSTWEIGTSLLKETGQSLLIYGIVIVFAAWLAGPTGVATSIRSAIAPYLRQPRFAYGFLAVLLVLLFWWDPVVATSRLVPSLIIVILLALGIEMLRRQVIREFPERVTTYSAEGAAQAIAARMREAREARLARRTAPAAVAEPASPEERRIEQLERLARLREAGVLSDEEFDREKHAILNPS
jgi:hypothetical protein